MFKVAGPKPWRLLLDLSFACTLKILFFFRLNLSLKKFHSLSINYVLFKNVKCKVMFTEAYLEPSRTSTMEFFSLWLNQILKTYSIWSNCLLGSIFYITPEKTYNCENFRRKSLLLTIEHLFFRSLKLCHGVASSIKKDFKLGSVKSVKIAPLFSFFFISNIMAKTFIESERQKMLFWTCHLPHTLKLFESNKMCFFCTSLMF